MSDVIKKATREGYGQALVELGEVTAKTLCKKPSPTQRPGMVCFIKDYYSGNRDTFHSRCRSLLRLGGFRKVSNPGHSPGSAGRYRRLPGCGAW